MEHTTPTIPQSTPPQSIYEVTLAKYESVSTYESENKRGWVDYGLNNLYPNYLAELAENVPTHGGFVRGISQMIAGVGVEASAPQANKFLSQWEINEQIDPISFDLYNFGGYYLEVIKPKLPEMAGYKQAKVNHLSFFNIRKSYNKETGEVDGGLS